MAILPIEVDVRGANSVDQLNGRLSKLEKTGKATTSSISKLTANINFMTKAALGYVAVDILGGSVLQLGKNVINTADAYTNMNSRLALATDNTYELVEAQRELFEVSQDTRTGLTATADLFERITRSTRDYGTSQEEIIDLTESINQAMVISGGTAESMNASIIQLGQAFSADFQAVGQELASIREQTPRLYQALLDGMDMTSKEFKKFAEDGKLSSEQIIEALKSQAVAIEEEFGKMEKTIDQSMTQASNSTLVFVGKLDDLLGISDKVGKGIEALTEFIDGLTESIEEYKLMEKRAFQTETQTEHFKKMEILGRQWLEQQEKIDNAWFETTANAYRVRQKEIEGEISLMLSNFEMLEDELETIGAGKVVTNDTKSALTPSPLNLDDWRRYYTAIGDLENAWALEQIEIADKYQALSDEQYNKLFESAKANFFDKFREEQQSLNEEIENAIDEIENNEIQLNIKGWEQIEDSFSNISSMMNNLTEMNEDFAQTTRAVTNASSIMVGNYTNQLKIQEEIRQAELQGLDTQHLQIKATHDNTMAYGQLAGAISGAFENGSKEAKALQVVQAGLAVYAGVTAILNAGASGDAYTAPARIAAMTSIVGGVLGLVGLSIGGGGAGGGGSAPNRFEVEAENIESANELIVNRLDRQIELLEAINLGGSAAAVSIRSASQTFAPSLDVIANEFLAGIGGQFSGYVNEDWFTSSEWENLKAQAEQNAFVIAGNYGTLETFNLNLAAIQGDFIGFLESFDNGLLQTIIGREDGAKKYNEAIGAINEAIGDYAKSMLEVVGQLDSASETLKRSFDNITGTEFFELQKLNDAYKDFDNIRGKNSYSEYIKNQITSIDNISDEFNEDVISILLNESLDNVEKRADVLTKLSKELGQTFENGAEDALNYIDSIELVSDAIADSRENIESFENLFKTDFELLENSANKLGVSVATTDNGLQSLFKTLQGGIDGLNDSELDFLKDNKKHLEQLQKDREAAQKEEQKVLEEQNKAVENYKDAITGVTKTIEDLINDIKGVSEETSRTTYESLLNEAKEAFLSGDSDTLTDIVSEISNFSKLDPESFSSYQDFAFAQASRVSDLQSLQNLIGGNTSASTPITGSSAVSSTPNIKVDTNNTDAALTSVGGALQQVAGILKSVTPEGTSINVTIT